MAPAVAGEANYIEPKAHGLWAGGMEEAAACVCASAHNEIRIRRTDPIYFIADGAHNGTNGKVEKVVSKQYTVSDTFKIYLSCQES